MIEKNRHILIVDDNKNIHTDFATILMQNNYHPQLAELEKNIFENASQKTQKEIFELDFAQQGKEGLEKVKTSIEKNIPFSVAFVDLRMPPGWDGIETIENLWKIDPHLQTVICTAFSDYSYSEIIHRLGYSDRLLILKKPFDRMEVAQMASSLSEKWTLNKMANIKTEYLEKMVEERSHALIEAEKNKQEIFKRIAQSEKLASLGTLAAGVGHEINNPLFIIKGNIEIIEDSIGEKAKDLSKPFTRINDSISRIENIVSGLRSHVRADINKEEILDLHEIIHSTVDLIAPLYLKEQIKIETQLNATEINLKGIRSRIQQVLINLLSNAKDSICEKKTSGTILLQSKSENQKFELIVSDDGVGISEDIIGRIYDAFFTTKEVGKGTGLGMGIVLSIIQQMNGQIEVKSTKGVGTQFFITLPCLNI